MLTPFQVDVVRHLAGSVWIAILLGGVPGVIAGGILSVRHTRRISSIATGAVVAGVPATILSVAVSGIVAALQTMLCDHGSKGGWDVPAWLVVTQIVLVVAAAVAGAFWALRHPPRVRLGRCLTYIVLGAAIGAIAHLFTAFDGYFVVASNARPVRQAIVGFLSGGGITAIWCLIVTFLHPKLTINQA